MEYKKDAAQSVTAADVQPYLKTPPTCPAGGTTFEDSYQLANVETPPTCKRRPDTHKLNL